MSSPEGFDESTSRENMEEPEWHFFYFNNEISDHPVIFECLARSQAEADSLYEEKIGKKPTGSDHVGCTSVKV